MYISHVKISHNHEHLADFPVALIVNVMTMYGQANGRTEFEQAAIYLIIEILI